MHRSLVVAILAIATLSCCADGEKIAVPPLPQDGAPLPYVQVLTRLSAQTDTAKEELFLNNWPGLNEAATGLENTVEYVLKAPDLPPARKASIEKSAADLKNNIIKLHEAARQKEQTQALELIRRIHNQVRELQDAR